MAKCDFDRAFPQTPSMFSEAIYRGFAEGRRREKYRRAVKSSLLVAAAAIVLAFGLYGGKYAIEDRVASPSGNASETFSGDVYTGLEDPYYHADPECAGGVEMSVEAARGFKKIPCPKCFENSQSAQ